MTTLARSPVSVMLRPDGEGATRGGHRLPKHFGRRPRDEGRVMPQLLPVLGCHEGLRVDAHEVSCPEIVERSTDDQRGSPVVSPDLEASLRPQREDEAE